MQPYLAFAAQHAALCFAFIALLIIFISLELKTKLSGLVKLSPHETVLLINREQAVIIDLRDSTQFARGHILGALNIPATALVNQLKQLEPHKEKPIILIADTNQTSQKAATLLQNAGHLTIKNLNGGMNAWINANLPLIKS